MQLHPVLVSLAIGLLCSFAQAEPVTASLQLDHPIAKAGQPNTLILQAKLRTSPAPARFQRAPLNLAIVLDRSGSMQGDKLARAKQGAIDMVRQLSARDVVSIIVYDTTVETLVPAQPVTEPEAIIRRIRDISAGANTALFGGVNQGAAEVRKRTDSDMIHRIVLLSDGLANVGPSAPADLARLGAALVKEGITVSTIGVGLDYNEDLMTALSRKGEGRAYFVESEADLPAIFKQELGEALSVVATRVTMRVELLGDARPLRIIGRDGRIDGQSAEIYLNQVLANQQKYALIEVQVPAGAADEVRDLARLTCTYEVPSTGQVETARATAQLRFSNDQAVVTRAANQDVLEAFAVNQVAIVKEETIAMMDKGDKDQAIQFNIQNAVRLEELGRAYNNDALIKQGEAVRQQAQQLDEEGMDRRSRKTWRKDAYESIQQMQ